MDEIVMKPFLKLVYPAAGNKMSRFDLAKLRVSILAAFCRTVTPLHKTALVWQVDRRSDLTADQLASRLFLSDDRKRNCRQQCLGIRMHRILEEYIGWCFFYHLSQVHNRNVVGEIFYDRQIVGDENISQSQISLQFFQQV